ncbi:MAG: hypothetical protein A2Y10_10775 [Planctomycetes bacterium GWF2_41_51]|nr:MAG: hypothetical protein A2Y10_10775 [Planctomycetes bacterium GWF2_41_51]HBG28471.1 hypothetical protein [Phycisphaerales bacterium]
MLKVIIDYIEKSWLLIVSAFVFGLLLAFTNSAWQGRIEQNKTGKLNNLMSALIADANFNLVLPQAQVNLGKGKMAKTDVYQASSDGQSAGFCFKAEGTGFADKIELVIAVDSSFEKVLGYSVLSSNETPGFGDQIINDFFRMQFIGAPVAQLNLEKKGDDKNIDQEIIAISGATVSSNAVVNIFNNYLQQVKELLKQKGIVQ